MKVTKIDVFMLDAGAQRKSRKPVCCRIYTDEGIYGDGEAGVAYGVGATGAFGCLEDLAHMVIGKNPFEVEKIWEMLFRETFWGLNGGAIFYAAMSAIDIALMDIKGKALGVPVYELIGGKQNDLRFPPLIGFHAPDIISCTDDKHLIIQRVAPAFRVGVNLCPFHVERNLLSPAV